MLTRDTTLNNEKIPNWSTEDILSMKHRQEEAKNIKFKFNIFQYSACHGFL